ncbi:MAG: riboflavin synthase [Bacteriovorax sp.]|nr:riboflavin synthase [Bacteriovorax sp.]
MFTGLIKDIGKIVLIEDNLEGKIFEIETILTPQIAIDDSVAVNGVCLTTTAVIDNRLRMQAVHITLEKTNLGFLQMDSSVNLELALKYSDRLGGHLVQGHVNAVARALEISNVGENYNIWYEIPQELMKFIVKEGSIAIDGISLTVADIKANQVMVTIIPHTWNETQIHNLVIGTKVNIEVDSNAVMMANYLDVLFANYMKDKGL